MDAERTAIQVKTSDVKYEGVADRSALLDQKEPMSRNKKICIGLSISCVIGLVLIAWKVFSDPDLVNPFEEDTSTLISDSIFDNIITALSTQPDYMKYNYNKLGDPKTSYLGKEGWGQTATSDEDPTGSIIYNKAQDNNLRNVIHQTRMRDQRKSDYFAIQNMASYQNDTGAIHFYDAQFATFNLTDNEYSVLKQMNATNGTNVTELFAWETVKPLINGYARIMRFSQRNSEDPSTLVYGKLKLDQLFEGTVSQGRPNGLGKDLRATGDNDMQHTVQWGFFKNGFNIYGKGRIYHRQISKVKSLLNQEYGLYNFDKPSSLFLGPVFYDGRFMNFVENDTDFVKDNEK